MRSVRKPALGACTRGSSATEWLGACAVLLFFVGSLLTVLTGDVETATQSLFCRIQNFGDSEQACAIGDGVDDHASLPEIDARGNQDPHASTEQALFSRPTVEPDSLDPHRAPKRTNGKLATLATLPVPGEEAASLVAGVGLGARVAALEDSSFGDVSFQVAEAPSELKRNTAPGKMPFTKPGQSSTGTSGTSPAFTNQRGGGKRLSPRGLWPSIILPLLDPSAEPAEDLPIEPQPRFELKLDERNGVQLVWQRAFASQPPQIRFATLDNGRPHEEYANVFEKDGMLFAVGDGGTVLAKKAKDAEQWTVPVGVLPPELGAKILNAPEIGDVEVLRELPPQEVFGREYVKVGDRIYVLDRNDWNITPYHVVGASPSDSNATRMANAGGSDLTNEGALPGRSEGEDDPEELPRHRNINRMTPADLERAGMWPGVQAKILLARPILDWDQLRRTIGDRSAATLRRRGVVIDKPFASPRLPRFFPDLQVPEMEAMGLLSPQATRIRRFFDDNPDWSDDLDSLHEAIPGVSNVNIALLRSRGARLRPTASEGAGLPLVLGPLPYNEVTEARVRELLESGRRNQVAAPFRAATENLATLSKTYRWFRDISGLLVSRMSVLPEGQDPGAAFRSLSRDIVHWQTTVDEEVRRLAGVFEAFGDTPGAAKARERIAGLTPVDLSAFRRFLSSSRPRPPASGSVAQEFIDLLIEHVEDGDLGGHRFFLRYSMLEPALDEEPDPFDPPEPTAAERPRALSDPRSRDWEYIGENDDFVDYRRGDWVYRVPKAWRDGRWLTPSQRVVVGETEVNDNRLLRRHPLVRSVVPRARLEPGGVVRTRYLPPTDHDGEALIAGSDLARTNDYLHRGFTEYWRDEFARRGAEQVPPHTFFRSGIEWTSEIAREKPDTLIRLEPPGIVYWPDPSRVRPEPLVNEWMLGSEREAPFGPSSGGVVARRMPPLTPGELRESHGFPADLPYTYYDTSLTLHRQQGVRDVLADVVVDLDDPLLGRGRTVHNLVDLASVLLDLGGERTLGGEPRRAQAIQWFREWRESDAGQTALHVATGQELGALAPGERQDIYDFVEVLIAATVDGALNPTRSGQAGPPPPHWDTESYRETPPREQLMKPLRRLLKSRGPKVAGAALRWGEELARMDLATPVLMDAPHVAFARLVGRDQQLRIDGRLQESQLANMDKFLDEVVFAERDRAGRRFGRYDRAPAALEGVAHELNLPYSRMGKQGILERSSETTRTRYTINRAMFRFVRDELERQPNMDRAQLWTLTRESLLEDYPGRLSPEDLPEDLGIGSLSVR